MVATVTDEQFAARELVRDWARNTTSGPGGTAAIREIEQGWDKGEIDAWRPVFTRLADLGLFGVAIPEDSGGAGGSIEDLCAMVEEAAKALVPGPIATTALATVVLSEAGTDPELLSALATGERFAGLALEGDVQFDSESSQASGTVDFVLGASNTVRGGVLLLPSDGKWVLVDTGSDGVQVEPLQAADFSRPLARVVLTSAPATPIAESRERVEELAATVLAAEAAGITRWSLETAVAYAKVREQFGKPIGSFQAIKHLCAEMLCRAEQAEVAAADAARAPAPQRTPGRPTSSPSPRRWPRASASLPRRPTSGTASRFSAASAAPGNTTRICICAAHTPSAGSSAAPSAGCVASPR